MWAAFPGVRKFEKKSLKKHENPVPKVMDVSSDEDVDKEAEDPERIKSASDALQVLDKVIRFSHLFENEELRESIVKVIESLQDLKLLRRRQTKITAFYANKYMVM